MSEANDSPSSSRELVALASAPAAAAVQGAVRRPAAFLAHLIATARQVPQTRERRRAEASEVIAAYEAAIAKIKELNAQ